MELTLNDALKRLEGVTGSGKQYYAQCPAHSDNKASLSISESEAGKLLLFCQAGCSFDAIMDALNNSTMKPAASTRTRRGGNARKQVVATYDYTDEHSTLLFQKVRNDDKSFIIRRPADNGRWINNRKGVPLVPYNLPTLINSDYVYLVEGEKDVDTLRKMNIAACCSPDGAGASGKFKQELLQFFTNKSVFIIADNDEIGKAFAQDEARILAPVAKSVKILNLLKICPALPEHGDITDVVEALGLTAEQTQDALTSLVSSTPEYVLGISTPIKTLCAADVEVKDVSWLWRNVLVQGGLNSVQGISGIGKSFLLCAISAAVSNGGNVQSVSGNMERLQRGKVLYLSGDDDVATTIVPRLNGFNADLHNIHFAPNGTLPPIGSVEFEQLCEAAKPSICIVDTIQHFLPPRTELNSANSTTVALQPLKVLAEKYNCSVVAIQHISKTSASGNGGFSVNFGIGSAAVNGLFRSVWTLGRIKGKDGKPTETRALAPSKTNLVAGDPPAILFDLSLADGFQWAGVDYELTAEQLYNPLKRPAHRPSDKREQAKELILDLLKNGGMVSSKLQETVIEQVGCSGRTYKTACVELELKRYQSGRQWYTTLSDEP
jgi:hypothetical protein